VNMPCKLISVLSAAPALELLFQKMKEIPKQTAK
jgi:hypothetical protein